MTYEIYNDYKRLKNGLKEKQNDDMSLRLGVHRRCGGPLTFLSHNFFNGQMISGIIVICHWKD